MKNDILLRGNQRHSHQRFDELLGHPPSSRRRQAPGRARHFDPLFLGEGSDSACTQRLNQARDAHPTQTPIKVPRFQQRLLLARKVDFMAQKPPHFLERAGNQVRGKSVGVLLVGKILGQTL